MTHLRETTCPFIDRPHPRGPTCCSLDATTAAIACRTLGCDLFALLEDDLGHTDAYGLGHLLRDAFINLVVFHHGQAERRDALSKHPMMKAYEEARARGWEFPDWPFDTFVEKVQPMAQAGEWLIQLGESFHGVRVVRIGARRG